MGRTAKPPASASMNDEPTSEVMKVAASTVAQWPSTVKAAEQLGISTFQLGRLAVKGEIQRERAHDGTWRYNPKQLADYVETDVAIEEKAERDDPRELGAAELLKQATELLKQSQTHNEKLLSMVLEPARLLAQQLGIENLRINDRCSQLEQGRLDTIALVERLTTEAHERELATSALKSSEARKQAAFSMLMQQAPSLIGQLGAAVGMSPAASLNPEQREQVSEAIKLLQSLDVNQLQVLIGSGFLTPAQSESVQRIVGAAKAPTPAAPAVESNTSAPEQSEPNG